MKRFSILALLLLLVLCACSNRQTETESPSAGDEAEESTPAESTGQQTVPPEGAVIVETEQEPVYVYLPTDTEASDDLVFSEWVTEDAEEAEPAAKYQDVSEVENAIAIPSVYCAAGETVTMPLRVCGQVELCALDLRITFDKNRVKYVGCENADDDLLVHCNEETGTVRLNFLRIANLEDGFTFCDLQFEALTTENCDSRLQIEVVEAVSLDDSGEIVFCDVSTVDGVLHLNQEKG